MTIANKLYMFLLYIVHHYIQTHKQEEQYAQTYTLHLPLAKRNKVFMSIAKTRIMIKLISVCIEEINNVSYQPTSLGPATFAFVHGPC